MPCVPLPPGSHAPQCHVEVPWCSCMLCADCFICAHWLLTAACVWVRLRVVHVPCALCSTHGLDVHPGTQELQAGVCSLQGLRGTAALQGSAVVPAVSARRALADGLDLPNASRTNKTFRSGIARGARRQASAEMLRLCIVWAGGVLWALGCQLPLPHPSSQAGSFQAGRLRPCCTRCSKPAPPGIKSRKWMLDTCCLGKPNRAGVV